MDLDKKSLQNLQLMLTDIIKGDTDLLARPEFKYFTSETIMTALNFLVTNQHLSPSEKAYLISNSWKVNYRAKPPSPEDFITEKYLGRSAVHTYERVKKTFVAFLDPSKTCRDLILYPHIGWGKMHNSFHSKVLTPKGPKIIGEMKVGDTVCTPNGETANITAVKAWEDKEFAMVTFADGRQVHSGLDHFFKAAKSRKGRIWDKTKKKYVYDKKKSLEPCWKIITIREIIKDVEKHPKAKWFVPLTKPAMHAEQEHVIDPYTLGALIGDGYITEGSAQVVGDDLEITEKLSLPYGYTNRPMKEKHNTVNYTYSCSDHGIMEELFRFYGKKTKSYDKFIPDEYLYDSLENRIALLQGLMDTDGTVNKKRNGTIHLQYYTTSEKLRDSFLTLIRGLGGKASSWQDNRYLKENATAKRAGYVIYLTFPNNDFAVFGLRRKQDLVDKDFKNRKTDKPQYLYIDKIEKTDNDDGTCIEIDDQERLFLVDDYVVTHNSYLSTLVNLYIGTHLSLMRNPYKLFGLNPASILTQVLISYSLKKSSELLLEPMLAILSSSPFYEKVRTKDGMLKKDQDFERQENVDRIFWTTATPLGTAVQLSNGANIKLASTVHSLLGLTIVTGTMSELAFFRDAGKSDDYIMRIFNDLKSRVESRMRGNYFGRTILDSSPNTLDSPIDEYIVNQAHKDPRNFIVQGGRWEWALPGEFDMTKTFHINKGGKGQPPYIVDSDEELQRVQNTAPNRLIEVPSQLKQLFVDDIYKALKDQAGIPSGSPDNLIYDYAKIDRIFQYPFKNIYTHIKASIKDAPENLIWNQVYPQFFTKVAGSYEFYYKPWIPRVLAVDQSLVHDVSAIVMMHVEKLRDSDQNIYIKDLTVPIAPMGERISLDAIKFFIEDLRNKGNIALSHLSFDQFQSEASIQYLNKRGFKVEKLSVDLTTDPYIFMLGLIETGRLFSGKNLHFKNNLKSIKFVKNKRSGKTKVDHDSSRAVITEGSEKWESSLIGSYAKDVSDAACACCELLRIYHPMASDLFEPDDIIKIGSPEGIEKQARESITEIMQGMGVK